MMHDLVHVPFGWLLLCLCVLAHALTGRLPATRYLTLVAALVWGFALALVVVLVVRGLRGS